MHRGIILCLIILATACNPVGIKDGGDDAIANAENAIYKGARGLIEANDPKACLDWLPINLVRAGVVRASLNLSEDEIYDYHKAGGAKIDTVSATDVDEKLHRVSCSAKLNISEDPQEVSTVIYYTIAPELAGKSVNVEWRVDVPPIALAAALDEDWNRRMNNGATAPETGEADDELSSAPPTPSELEEAADALEDAANALEGAGTEF